MATPFTSPTWPPAATPSCATIWPRALQYTGEQCRALLCRTRRFAVRTGPSTCRTRTIPRMTTLRLHGYRLGDNPEMERARGLDGGLGVRHRAGRLNLHAKTRLRVRPPQSRRRQRHQQQATFLRQISSSRAIDAAGRVYLGNGSYEDGRLYAFDADLTLLWQTSVTDIYIGGSRLPAAPDRVASIRTSVPTAQRAAI